MAFMVSFFCCLKSENARAKRGLINPELFHAIAQGAQGDAQRAGSGGFVVAVLFQRALDALAFDGVELGIQRRAAGAGRGAIAAGLGRQAHEGRGHP